MKVFRLMNVAVLRRACLFHVIVIALTVCSAEAQIQQAWVARYNNGITSGTNQVVKMALDSPGNICLTGYSQNANTNLGYATLKYAPNGNQLWLARYDTTTTPNARPTAMSIDISNDVIVTGSALTVKYDPNGNLLWTAPYAGTALAVDSNANIYVAGFSTNFATQKLSPQGSNVWQTSYSDPSDTSGPTVSQSVLVDSVNNVYVSGLDTYFPAMPGSPGYVQLTTINYDSNGMQKWKSTQNPNFGSFNVQVRASCLDGANNIFVLADFYTTGPRYDIVKYAANGDLFWNSTVRGDDGASVSSALVLDAGTNCLVTGLNARYYPSYCYGTFKLSAGGSIVWSNNYPFPSVGVSGGSALAVDSANNTYVTGYSPGANGSNDIVTIKYGPNGNQVWLQRYSSPGGGNAAGNAIVVDNIGNVYVAGYDTTAAGGTEMVLIKYAPLALQRQPNGTVILQAQGSPGESINFQGSVDLVNWIDLGSVEAGSNGVAKFTDTTASNYSARFYSTNPQ